MPDRQGNTKASDDAIPDTSLHAYKEERKEDISGDADKLESNDPKDQQQHALEGDDELDLHHEKR
jgi:hypothetical protein